MVWIIVGKIKDVKNGQIMNMFFYDYILKKESKEAAK